MTILGPLAGESPEPMTREQFDAARKRLRSTLDGVVTMDKRDLERLIAEVIWLKRRLYGWSMPSNHWSRIYGA